MQLAKGMRDFSPKDMMKRNEVTKKMVSIFERYGFLPLQTPIIERLDSLTAKFSAGSDADVTKEMYTLSDQGKRELGLRFDLTVPLARYVSCNPEIKLPFKRYQIGRVFRDGPIKLGRYREFWQYDIDIVGTKSMRADGQILLLVKAVFEELGIDVKIFVNNRKLLNEILKKANVPQELAETTIISIDKLEKIKAEGVLAELESKGVKQGKEVLEMLSVQGTNEEKIAYYEKLFAGTEAVEELKDLFSMLKSDCFVFVPSLARGLAYYTGPVFEAFCDKLSSSVAGGGRYDEMVGNFIGNREVPATGVSFGFETILDVLEGNLPSESTTKLFVIPIGDVVEGATKVAEECRASGINTDMDILGRGISANIRYATSYSIPYVLFVGENELKSGMFKLKDLREGKEQEVDVKSLVSLLS